MRVALDSNCYSDLMRGDQKLAEELSKCQEVCLPLPVIAELKAGFAFGGQRYRNEASLMQFLAEDAVSILTPGLQTAETYAQLWVQLKVAGTPIPIDDIWIAALCLEHGLLLVTRDKHFDRLPQLLTDGFE